MITFKSGSRMVQEASELPQVPDSIQRLYFDFETSSGHPSRESTNPWFDCQAIGVGAAFDDGLVHWVPKHLLVTGWWRDVMRATVRGVGHNVKYDAHVSKNDLSVDPPVRLVDTLTGAKLIDSDRLTRGGYGLDALSKQWLGHDIMEHYWRLGPYLVRNKDFANVPEDILAEYCCADVEVTRGLSSHIERGMPEESAGVWAVEQDVTRLLYEIEQTGVRVDPLELKKTTLKTLYRMADIDERLERLVGRSFRASVSADCHDVLCVQYGLPVLAWTEPQTRRDGSMGTPGPSFDWDALQLYLQHPDAPQEVVKLIVDYRELDTFNNLFLSCWDELNIGGVLHPTYNQTVRTGRMSCSEPNLQQLSKMAKELIVPRPGMAIVQSDFSQIEFRVIAHYIENRQWIDAYNRDPWTDAHTWVATMCHMDRTPAKTMNFMMGYGGGKRKAISSFSVNKDFVGKIVKRVDAGLDPEQRARLVSELCEREALDIYESYHRTLPELKPTSRHAASVCAARGYVRNHLGRRRHLPQQFAHKAFNSLCQATAADIMKERMVALWREVPELTQIAVVHDQVVGECDPELCQDESFLRRVTEVMADLSKPLRVPIRAGIGWSTESWAKAQKKEFKF